MRQTTVLLNYDNVKFACPNCYKALWGANALVWSTKRNRFYKRKIWLHFGKCTKVNK